MKEPMTFDQVILYEYKGVGRGGSDGLDEPP